ncbi:MAG: outer membrane protein assembly factor BamA [Candidatus Rokubacteria bacterium]|nr:outer membrane protein assembly factor BamA [Candidatus Rokubacteria bacterium]
MTRAGRALLSIFFALAALASTGAWAQSPPAPIPIKEISVEGNRRVQEAVILGRIQTTVGSPFVPARLADDLRAIFALGFFDDVQMRVEEFEGGVKITFVVVERPFIRDVEFAGNKKVDTATLQEKADVKLGSVYNPVEVERARERIKDHYEEEGYFEVKITPETEKFPDGDVKVVFRIAEGRRITIEKIVIKGHKGLTDKQIKKVMVTQERQYYILRGTVQRQKLDEDVERILALYNDHGYIQVRVESHDVVVDREKARVTVTVTVVEGPQFHIKSVDITGASVLPLDDIRRQVLLKPGDVFSRSRLRASVDGVTRLYSSIGRASVDVAPLVGQNLEDRTVGVKIEITEGPEVYVERINIAGNTRSQEKILRREIPFAEGDLFTSAKLDRAKQRLTNLGFFETVKTSTTPGADKTKIIVNIDVVEKPTGMFSIGGGFSSVDSLIGTVDLTQRNFLGRGWEVAVKFRGGSKGTLGTLSFTEPWLFDQPLSAGADLFDTRRIFDEYTQESLGGDVRFSHPFLDFARWFLSYRLTSDTISSLQGEAAISLASERGERVTSAVSGSVSRDTRDNVFTPSKGNFATIGTDVAGLGGDSKFVKFSGSMSQFVPIWFNHVLAGRAEAGYVFGYASKEVPLFERFVLGGPNSVRSFKFRGISPVDENGVKTGGTSEVLGSLEYVIPLPFNFRIAGFFDVGNVYGFGTKFDLSDLKYAAGPSIRWVSPFGPIRVDYGFNLNPQPGERDATFNFSVGSPF